MPGILGWAKLWTDWTAIALTYHMFRFNVFPKSSFVLGCPHAVHALPEITGLAHLCRYFSLKIYTKKKQWQQDQSLAVFISSGTTVEFALVLFPRILCWAKLGTERATVACRLDMLGFNMLPKTRLIFGCPKTVFALPKVAQLDHFVWYCCLKIYRERLIEPHI